MQNIENVSSPETTPVSGQDNQQDRCDPDLPAMSSNTGNTVAPPQIPEAGSEPERDTPRHPGNLPNILVPPGLAQHECNALLPTMPPEKLEALREDIRENGLKVPIVLCDGKVLDGWQRFQICREFGIEPRFDQFVGDDPMVGFLSLNIARRHLEKSQLAVLACRTQTLMSEGAKSGSTSELGDAVDKNVTTGRGRIRSKLAAVFGVSEGYIQQAKTIKEVAPDLFDKVAAGTMNLNEADTALQERTPKGGATGNQSGKKSGEPPVQLRLKNLIERVCKILNSLDNDDHGAAYSDLLPILKWAEDHELWSKGIEKLHPDAPEWADNLTGDFALPKAA